MKKISVLGVAVCFFIICCLSLSEAVNIKRLIIGKWIENNRNSLELVEDGTAIVVEEGKSAAGNYKFLPDGRLKIDLGGFWGSKVFEVSIDKEGRLNLKEPNGEVTKYLTEKAYKLQQEKKGRIAAAKTQIELLCQALDQFRVDAGRYPTTTEGLNALVVHPGANGWDGPYLKKAVPNDPWKRPYVYQSPGTHGKYDLYSYGADGMPGGEGENKDITSWE